MLKIIGNAESARELSESSDDSSSSYVLSSDSVTSSDNSEEVEPNEETLAASSSQEKRSKRSGSSVAKSTSRIKKGKDSTLNDEEMEALVSWIFSLEESNKVDAEVRATLLDDPRIKLEPARIKVVEHMLDVAQKHLFETIDRWVLPKIFNFSQRSFRQ